MEAETREEIARLKEKNRLIADNLIDAVWILDAQTLS